MGRRLGQLKSFLGGLFGLIVFLVIGGIVIAFLFRGCEGNHRYMNVGVVGGDGSRGLRVVS